MTNPPTHKMEQYKLLTDYLKHLTTLSTGSIVLLAAFLEKIFREPKWKVLVVFSLAGFMLSVVTSIVAHTIAIADFPGEGRQLRRQETAVGSMALLIAWVGFLAGVFSLTIFAMRNLFN